MFSKFSNYDNTDTQSTSHAAMMEFAQQQVQKYDKDAKVITINAGADVSINDASLAYPFDSYNVTFEIVAVTADGHERTAYSTFNEFIEFLVDYEDTSQ